MSSESSDKTGRQTGGTQADASAEAIKRGQGQPARPETPAEMLVRRYNEVQELLKKAP